jgi:bifunctional UDP-N-acetylglucosamine pyrophosphorylase / glucosamine-1-phosphate N-acetyltransferase
MSQIISPVILAAGDGKRMQSTLPKVMHLLHGKPLVEHAVIAAETVAQLQKPVIIVSPKHTMVQDHLGDRAQYVVQEQQLGTGHAVMQAQGLLHGVADHVVVLYGDMPFVTPASIEQLIAKHIERGNTVTLMTATVPSFENEFSCFAKFGRIVRLDGGYIQKIVEAKDASEGELQILEVNPSIFCFKAEWLWHHLNEIQNTNAQGEFYLTDLIEMAIADHQLISSVPVAPREAMGINTKEELDSAAAIV